MWGGLAAADFEGPITFESFSSAVVSPSLSNTLCVWRDLYATPLPSESVVHTRMPVLQGIDDLDPSVPLMLLKCSRSTPL